MMSKKGKARRKNEEQIATWCPLCIGVLGFLWAASPVYGQKEAGDLQALLGPICEEVCCEPSVKGLL